MDRDAARRRRAGQASSGAKLVQAARDAGEVGEHRVADGRGYLVVRQCVKPDIDDAARLMTDDQSNTGRQSATSLKSGDSSAAVRPVSFSIRGNRDATSLSK